ncbi:MAG: phosphoribosylanthranilate isomerase, partial [Calditrichaeota bacterium]|nr:phosphoribosylanthranilate isomerase [Calditrichota bacterium]
MKHIIQIAGIIDAAEAQLLLDSGVDWLGFPLRLTVNAEDINDADAAAIIANLPENRSGVLITYLNTAAEILELCKMLHAKTVQIHGNIELAELQHLRKSAPDVFILKSLIVRGDNLSELEN